MLHDAFPRLPDPIVVTGSTWLGRLIPPSFPPSLFSQKPVVFTGFLEVSRKKDPYRKEMGSKIHIILCEVDVANPQG